MNKYKCKLVIRDVEVPREVNIVGNSRKISVERDLVLTFVPFPSIVIDNTTYDTCHYYTETNEFILACNNFHPYKYIPKGFTEIVKGDK
jgi:hypothetical protein